MIWWSVACVPADVERDAVALAAADLLADVMARLIEESVSGGPATGNERHNFEASEEVTDPDWAGTLLTSVTWEGDPDGSCACRGDCAASRWSFSSAIDLRFRHDTSLTWCTTSTGAPDGDPPDIDLVGTLSGEGGLGPAADDLECAGSWPTWSADGALTVVGIPETRYDVSVTILPDGASDDVTLSIDGERQSWSYSCGV